MASERTAEPPARPGPVHPVAAFALAGFLLGALDGFLASPPQSPRVLVALFAAVLGSAFAVALGVAIWGVLRTARRIPPIGRARDAVASRLEALREPGVVRTAYALALAAVIMAAVSTVAGQIAFPILFELQEQRLAQQLAVVVTGALIVASLAGTLVGAAVFRRAIDALAKRFLRLGAIPAAAPYFAFVTLPLFLGVYPFIQRHGRMLGLLREVTFTLLVVALAVQVALALRAVPSRARRAVSLALGAAFLVGLVAVGALAGKRASTFSSSEASAVASLGARTLRFLTDVDRDGASSLFGGQDCAPFDADRAPGRPEIPGNGIDEDCDGSDEVGSGALAQTSRFSDALGKRQVKKYNIVWILMETVRADHVSAIDYDKPTTPYLAKLAKESLVFTRAYSQSSATVLSIPSMLSGVDPGMASWRRERNHPQLEPEHLLISERLKGSSYRTGFVLDTYLKHTFTSIQRGFDDVLLAEPDNKRKNNRPRRNLISTAKAAEFMAKLKPEQPFFLVVYYPDAHSPYTRHKDVDSSRFEKGELGDYDTELLFTDQQIRALIEMMKARPALWDETIVVVTADHGEEFGEHGGARHALTCWDEVVHVPLLVRIPGIPAQRIDTRVALVDIVPTLLELVGAREGTEGLSGQSLLVPALKPEKLDPQRPIFCNIASITNKYGTFFRRSVRTDDYTLVHDVNEGKFGLFDARKDRGEQNDVSAVPDHANALSSLKAILDASLTGNLRDHTKMGAPAGAPKPEDDPEGGDAEEEP